MNTMGGVTSAGIALGALVGAVSAPSPLAVCRGGDVPAAMVIELQGDANYTGVSQKHPAVFVPSFIPAEQLYYWTDAWQQGERETREDVARGDVRRFRTRR